MAITAALRQDIMELAVLTNNAAPGTTLLGELVTLANSGSTLTQIADTLVARAEFKATYPTHQTSTEFASEWLGNALPEASAALKAECVTIVEAHINGGGTVAALIVSVQDFMSNASEADANLGTHIKNFNNKVTVATYHTITKEAAAEWDIPATVTSDAATVTTGNTAVDTATAPAAAQSQTKSLTAGTDIITGGSGDDVFNGVRVGAAGTTLSYTASDQLDGGAGTDTLYVESTTHINLALQKSFEKISINSVGGPTNVTLPNDKAYTNLEVLSNTGNVDFLAIKNGAVDATLSGTANGNTVTLTYFGTALTGAADNLDVSMSGADGTLTVAGATAVNALETVTLDSVSDGELDALALGTASTTGLILTGAGAANIKSITGAAATLNSYDASAATGAVTLTGINTTANTITGGSGNDSLAGAAGNDTVSSGKGDDQVTGAAGNDSITLGAGDDTAILTGSNVDKNDVIDGGEGTDTLELTGALTYTTTGTAVDDAVGVKNFEALKSGGAITAMVMTGLNANNTITSAEIEGHTVSMTKDTGIATVTFTADNSSLTMDTAGTQTLNLKGGGVGVPVHVASTTLKSAATAVNLVSAGNDAAANNDVALTGTALATLTVTGSEKIDVTANASKVVATADFSGSTATEASFSASISEAALTYKTAAGTQTTALTTGKGADTITLGTQDDTVTNSGDGADTITGGGGNDTITQTGKGADTITLGDGNDTVTDSGAGADVITAGGGNDNIADTGADNDTVTLGDGNDTGSGGAGNDSIDGGAGNDVITGGTGDDSLTGGAGNDTITDGTGNDTVTGGDGVDTITISTGNDNVDAGAGDDAISITGLSGADTIDGGAGTDSITITNSSTGTLTPAFTNIESATVKTSSAFTLSLTTATDKTSLTSYNISSTSAGADNISIVDAASGTTVTISDDNSWDGASTADVDDSGDIGTVSIDTVAGGTLTIHVNTNEDAVTHVASAIGGTTTGDAGTVTITSSNADSNKLLNDITSLDLDDTETSSLTLTANANAGIDTGVIATTAALQSFSVTSAANTDSVLGTLADATALQTWSAAATGGTGTSSTTLTTGVVGGGTTGVLTSINAQVTGVGSTISIDSINSANSTALTSIALGANSANSSLKMATTTGNHFINAGTGTVASLNITVADNATLEIDTAGATGTITSGTIAAATVSLGDYSTFVDESANTNDNLSITGLVTALNLSLGRDITSDANDDILFAGGVTGLTLSSSFDDDALDMDTNNVIDIGTVSVVDIDTSLATASYQHTGTGLFTWAGVASGNLTLSSTATSSTSDTMTGGAGNDTLTGNTGTNTLVGGAANDTLTGNEGADSLSGGAGNDVLNGGDGADTMLGGAGNDTITATESTAAADVIQLTNGVAAITTVGTGSGDDTGADTITGFDTANDTLDITATGVVNFVHGTDTGFRGAATGTASGGTVLATELATNVLHFDFDTASAVQMGTAGVDMAINMASLKTSGVAYTLTSDTAMEAKIRYDITGTAAANTVTGGALNDTIDGGAGIDAITGGAGSDVIIIGDSTDGNNYDVITGFTTTADDIKALQSVHGWNTTDGTTTLILQTGATIKAADAAADSNIHTLSGNIATHTYATFMAGTSSYSQLEGTAITAMGLTGAVDAAAVILVAIDDTASTGLWQFTGADAGTDNAVAASEIELIAILVGVTDATALVVGDFLFA